MSIISDIVVVVVVGDVVSIIIEVIFRFAVF